MSYPTELKELKTIIRDVLRDRYSNKMLPTVVPSGGASCGSEQSVETNLCVTYFSSSADSASESNDEDNALGVVDEVEQYLAMGVVVLKVFIDVVQYWIVGQ
jgi:hypothetical protein